MAVQERILAAFVVPAVCAVWDCGEPTSLSARSGLNARYCRRHSEHFRRHGSYCRGSYRAADIRPYRAAALDALRAARATKPVREAVERVGTLYQRAGRSVEAFRLPGKSPEERAWAIWAALRVRQVDPVEVLAACCGVKLLNAQDSSSDRQDEYLQVQMAKVLHRMAGGTHKKWDRLGERPLELHVHPASRGMVLRHVGREAQRAAALAYPALDGAA